MVHSLATPIEAHKQPIAVAQSLGERLQRLRPSRAVRPRSRGQLFKRRQKRLERELATSLKTITGQVNACEKKTLFCLADAEATAKEAMAQPTTFHHLDVSVVERPRYARGRPKRNAVRTPIAIEYGLAAEILEDEQTIDRRRKMAGCFVLLSDVVGEGAHGYSAEHRSAECPLE